MDLRIAEFVPSALHYTDVSRTYPDISINEVGEHRCRGVIYVELHAIEPYMYEMENHYRMWNALKNRANNNCNYYFNYI